jgi:chorismate mutase
MTERPLHVFVVSDPEPHHAKAQPEDPKSSEDLKAVARQRVTDATIGLVHLLNQRTEAVLVIGAAKAAEGAMQIRDLEREEAVIADAVAANEGPLPDDAVAAFVQLVMNAASELQSKRFDIPVGIPLEQGPGFDYGKPQA